MSNKNTTKHRSDGEFVKEFRTIMKLSRQKFAEICNVSPSLIAELEAERVEKASIKIYEGILSIIETEEMNKFSDDFLKFITKYPKKDELFCNILSVPYYKDVRASMGKNGSEHFESDKELIPFDKKMLREIYHIHSTKGLSLINTFGDSMSPTIPSDAVVFVQECLDLPDGTICALVLDGELYIKRIQKRPVLKFISDNKSYDDIYINESYKLKILGKVIGIFKRL